MFVLIASRRTRQVAIACGALLAVTSRVRATAAGTGPDAGAPTGASAPMPAGAVWLEELDLRAMSSHFGRAAAGRSVADNPIRIAGVGYAHGVGTHAPSEMVIALGAAARRFVADVGVDDELACLKSYDAPTLAAARFQVFVDNQLRGDSGVLRAGDRAKRLDVDLRGGKSLRLVVNRENGSRFNHVDWAAAALYADGAIADARGVFTTAPRVTASPDAGVPMGAPPPANGEPATLEDEALLSRSEASEAKTPRAADDVVWLDDLQLKNAKSSGAAPRARLTPEGEPIRIGASAYRRGVSTVGETLIRVELAGGARRFVARAGLDKGFSCAKALDGGRAGFEVWVDGKRVVLAEGLHGWDAPRTVVVDVSGARTLLLSARTTGAVFDWAGAAFVRAPGGARPRVVPVPPPEPAVIAATRPQELGIHGARVVGTTPGRPFLFRVPATGASPLRFAAEGLPPGLTLASDTGIITGQVNAAGSTDVVLSVSDSRGARATRTLRIEAGESKLAATPPMGWNSWNVWGNDVNEDKVRASARALLRTGLVAHGYHFVNVDDAWEGARDAKGEIVPNQKFPHMERLAEFLHGEGLHFGIYSSPGPKTCGGFVGSYQHEAQDAATYARWGVDYLKYDWCSYSGIEKRTTLEALQKPYVVMSKALRESHRDIVFSLCQYGMGKVWTWGRSVGGNLWRTTGDITDTWASLTEIGFGQAEAAPHGGPGGWNDPDMLVVGRLGWSASLRPTHLTPNEQVTHLSLWSLLAAPLLLGCDLEALDPFTINLLTNDEVIDVDQDPLGRPATRRLTLNGGAVEVWARPLADGTQAVGVFNRGETRATVQLRWAEAGLTVDAKAPIRDLWIRKDVARAARRADGVSVSVPTHGAVLYKVGTPKP